MSTPRAAELGRLVSDLRREISTGAGAAAAPPARARFRALVEAGTLLATTTLPDYVPPVGEL
jgi:hypothetical protein